MKKLSLLFISIFRIISFSIAQGHWRLGGNPAFPPPDGVNAGNNIFGTIPNLPINIVTNGIQRTIVNTTN
jgi:hypothetical protein